MQMICRPEINNESSLPIYATGVGINDLQLPCSSSAERLFIVSEGSAAITLDGQKHALPKGSVCLLGENVSAMPEPKNSSTRISWITFAGSAASCPGLFTEKDSVVFRSSDPVGVNTAFLAIYNTLSADPMYGGFTASALLYQLIIRLNRDAGNIVSLENINPAISNILLYINENYTEKITLEKLCEISGGLSEQYICRLFKENTGMRPVEYILKKRISAARSYLENTDIPINDIAALTGFHNTSYFYRNFKKFTGMSPLLCRQNAYIKAAGR